MDTCLKRIVAFAIDILLVTTFVSLITQINIFNPYSDEYKETYDKYSKLMESDMNDDKVKDEMITLNYDLYRYSIVNNVISLVCILLYFGVLQMILKGQTIGKKIMNLRLVSNKDDKKLHIGNYLIRVVVLNNIIFTVTNIIAVYTLSAKAFYNFTYGLSFVQSTIWMIMVLMVVLRQDGRGLHDFLAGTKVIDLKPILNEDIIVEKVEKKKNSRKESK